MVIGYGLLVRRLRFFRCLIWRQKYINYHCRDAKFCVSKEIPLFFFIFAIVIMITNMKKTFTFLTIMLLFVVVSAQTVSVTFTGRDASNQYIPLNRVVVSNLTRGWQETLF